MAAPTATMSPANSQEDVTEQQAQMDQRAELPRPYKCTMCDKAFHRLEHQTRHIRTHTGEKPHTCQFPGCTKKFSRSDELTRHTRIHNNPNSRRGKQQAHQAIVAAARNGTHMPEQHHLPQTHNMPPPLMGSWSGHNSGMSTPNFSPTHSYSQHPSPYAHMSGHPMHDEAYAGQQNAPSMNILAHAASRAAEYDRISTPYHPSNYGNGPAQYSAGPYYLPGQQNDHQAYSARNGLSAYHYQPTSQPPSQPMSRTHSDEDTHYGRRTAKRSRPGSPYSTNPPSPVFSSASISPDSGYTPAMTPGHSPHIRASHKSVSANHLPGIRDLSMSQVHSPALEPLEPSTQASGSNTPSYPYSRSQNSSHAMLRIADLINKPDETGRTLPAPAVTGTETLPSMTHSGHVPMEM